MMQGPATAELLVARHLPPDTRPGLQAVLVEFQAREEWAATMVETQRPTFGGICPSPTKA